MEILYPEADTKYEEIYLMKEEIYLENIGKLNQKLKQEEDEIRKEYQSKERNFNKNLGINLLIDIYGGNIHTFIEESFWIPKNSYILFKLLSTKENGYTVESFSNFQTKWNELTNGIFNNFDWNNVVVAGGAVLSCLLKGIILFIFIFILIFILFFIFIFILFFILFLFLFYFYFYFILFYFYFILFFILFYYFYFYFIIFIFIFLFLFLFFYFFYFIFLFWFFILIYFYLDEPLFFYNTDIDLFIYDLSVEEANIKIQKIIKTISKNTGTIGLIFKIYIIFKIL